MMKESLKTQQKCQVEQGQMYIWICCSICCKHDATNGASDRLLTFLAVSLCVFKCSNIYCHFHGSSGAHALASLKPQQKCQVEQGQKNRVRCIYIYIWIFCSICCKHDATNGASGRLLTFLAVTLCVCSNAATSIAISMARAGAHALASLKIQQKCQVEQGQMYIWI